MSATAAAEIVVGLVLRRGELIGKGEHVRECPEGHQAKPGHSFCSRCGGKYAIRRLDAPRPAFAAYASSLGTTPEALWDDWLEADAESGGVMIFPFRQVRSGDPTETGISGRLILGKALRISWAYDESPRGLMTEDIARACEEMDGIARELGLDSRKSRAFCLLYFS